MFADSNLSQLLPAKDGVKEIGEDDGEEEDEEEEEE